MCRSHPRCQAPALGCTAWLLLVAVGCSGGQGPCEPEPPATVRALFQLAPGARTVFPSDQFTAEDALRPTGRRLALPAGGTPVIEPGLGVLMAPEAFTGLLGRHDGFSTWAPVLVPVSGALDPDSLPATAEAASQPSSSVCLVELAPGVAGRRLPARVEQRALVVSGRTEHLLVIQPTRPLAPATRHAVVITDGLLAADHTPVGPTADGSYVLGRCPLPDDHPQRQLAEAQREAVAALFEPALGIDPDRLVLADVFTTQSVEHELSAIRAQLRAELAEVAVDLDPDGDGQPDLYAPLDLPGAPPSALHLENVGLVLKGTFDSPAYRTPAGVFDLEPDGTPVVQALELVPFVLALPADPATQPFPVVLLQHGHGGTKERLLYVAGHLAAHGLASVAIDLVEHGERPRTGHGFLDFSNIPAIRANFEQSAVDGMRLVQLIEALAALDLVPGGVGDGTPDLDCGRLAMVGESAGAQVTSLMGALEPSIGAVVINVGGGGYSGHLEHYLGGFYDEATILPLGVLVQTLFDPGDPINFHRPYRAESPAGPEVQALLQEVIDDIAMPNRTTEDLARVYGCPQVGPIARPVEGLAAVEAPAYRQGLYQYHPAKHGFLLAEEEDLEASEAVRRQVTTFLRTWFVDGEAAIENPW